jgi:hypothetical protein
MLHCKKASIHQPLDNLFASGITARLWIDLFFAFFKANGLHKRKSPAFAAKAAMAGADFLSGRAAKEICGVSPAKLEERRRKGWMQTEKPSLRC